MRSSVALGIKHLHPPSAMRAAQGRACERRLVERARVLCGLHASAPPFAVRFQCGVGCGLGGVGGGGGHLSRITTALVLLDHPGRLQHLPLGERLVVHPADPCA